jgi:hypothetical protein
MRRAYGLGLRPEMAAEPPRPSRLQSLATALMAGLLRRFAEISAAAKHFQRHSHPLSLGNPTETAAAKQGAVAVSMDASGGSDVAKKVYIALYQTNRKSSVAATW